MISLAASVHAQPTIGLLTHTSTSDDSGYVLFAPMNYSATYLIDKCGEVVHTWNSAYRPALAAYLLSDGSLLRAGADLPTGSGRNAGALTEHIAWDGTVLWRFRTADTVYGQHHDIEYMPNGDVMIISFDMHTAAEAYAAGRDTTWLGPTFLSDRIIELRPVGADSAVVVWQWRAWDHLVQQVDSARPGYSVVANHPELINVNYPPQNNTNEWLHMNAVRYNPALDQVMISARNMGEIWIVDHSTSMAQAASHSGGRHGVGGDLLYRWGNPAAYARGAFEDQKFFGQHDPQWIPDGYPDAGKVIVFNNGYQRPGGLYSSIDVFSPAIDSIGNYPHSTLPYGPTREDWVYTATPPTDFFCETMGGCQLLANGNIVACNGTNGEMFELDSARKKDWDYICPVNRFGPMTQGSVPGAEDNILFKCRFYPASYPGVARARFGGPRIELNPTNYPCDLNVDSSLLLSAVHNDAPFPACNNAYPNPAADHIMIGEEAGRLQLFNALGDLVAEARHARTLTTAGLPEGVYLLVAERNGATHVSRISIAR